MAKTVIVELIEVGDIVFNAPIINVKDLNKHLPQKSGYVFKWYEFKGYDREGDAVMSVKFTKLPSKVVLKLNGVTITTSTEISKGDLKLGRFTADIPASEFDFEDYGVFVLKDAGSGLYSVDSGRLSFVIKGRENTAPVVNAGDDANVVLSNGGRYELNGSAIDDVRVTDIEWRKMSGGDYTIEDATNLKTTVYLKTKGVYTFRLIATDSDGVKAYDDIVLNCYTSYTSIYSSPDE